MVRAVDLQPLTAEELADLRRSGRYEAGPAFARPGGRSDPDEELSPPGPDDVVDGDVIGLRTDPLPSKPLSGREAAQAYAQHLLTKLHPAELAGMLRATAPTKFAHLTDDQLTDQLTTYAEERAKRATERTYNKLGR